MDETKGVKIPLKLHVLKEKNQLIFAEANSDFVDTLFSFLTLPMGTIVRLLKTHGDLQPGEFGCFGNLYESVENLDASKFWTKGCKEMLLNPTNVAGGMCRQLKLNLDDTRPKNYLLCCSLQCDKPELSLNGNAGKCSCGKDLEEPSMKSSMSTNKDEFKGGAFITETAYFIVTDGLHVIPNQPTTVFELFEKSGISELDAVDEINLNIGYKEMITLLKCSLYSNSPLTAAFLSNGSNFGLSCDMAKSFEIGMVKLEEPAEITTTIKLFIQKSNNKMLFAHAEENSVDFLFSLLTIPLGGVAHFLTGNISFGSIWNLYSSLLTLKLEKHLKSPALKNMLLSPQLDALHLSKNHSLSFHETKAEYYRHTRKEYVGAYKKAFSCAVKKQVRCWTSDETCVKLSLKDSKFNVPYTRPSVFIVTPDMRVLPLSSLSVVSYLRRLGIPLSDVEEQDINIGMAEAQKILKSSFKSNLVLTDEDIKIRMKPIKQEQL